MKKDQKSVISLAVIILVVVATFGFTIPPKEKIAETKPTVVGVNSDCTFKEFKLYGKIQVVDAFPDVKVQIVNAFPDLKVKVVDAFPDDCGEWQFVSSFPDVKVQFVDAFPDIKIQYVDAFPGKP